MHSAADYTFLACMGVGVLISGALILLGLVFQSKKCVKCPWDE